MMATSMSLTRRWSVGVVIFTVATLLLASAVASWARPPLSGSGAGAITSLVETSSRDAGGNRIAERRLEGFLTGTLEGTFVEEVRGVVRDGQVHFQGTLVFTGTVEGCGSGTVVSRLQGSGRAGPSPLTDATFRSVDQSSNPPAAGWGSVHQDGPFLEYEINYMCR